MSFRLGCAGRSICNSISESASLCKSPVGRPKSTAAGPTTTPAKSHIFDKPPVTTSTPSRRMERRREHLENVRRSATSEQKLEWSRWMADPWFRLSKTPPRECFVTRRMMPNGFLVNFRVARLKPDEQLDEQGDGGKHFVRPELHLVPDRVLHTKFNPRKAGKGYWTVLHHQIVERLSQRGPHQGQLARRKLTVSPALVGMVRAQLGRRIVQELEMLRNRIQGGTLRPGQRLKLGKAEALEVPRAILRHLTHEEAMLLDAGRYEGEEAIAFLDLSKQARRPNRPTTIVPGDRSTDEVGGLDREDKGENVPISTDIQTPTRTVPLYHISRIFEGATLVEFVRTAKNAVHLEWIEKNRALMAQQLQSLGKRGHVPAQLPAASPTEEANQRKKRSNILVLGSYPTTPESVRKGDVGVELAIALWRLRCYQGAGWEEFWADRMGRRV